MNDGARVAGNLDPAHRPRLNGRRGWHGSRPTQAAGSDRGGATYAALKQALADGRIRRDERAMLFNCATGLKYPLPPVHRTLDRLQPIDFAAL